MASKTSTQRRLRCTMSACYCRRACCIAAHLPCFCKSMRTFVHKIPYVYIYAISNKRNREKSVALKISDSIELCGSAHPGWSIAA